MDGTVTNLDSALDAQIEVMRAWVAVAQREQQHLLAVEPEGITACVRERETLTQSMADAIKGVHDTVADLRDHFGIGREEDVTVSTLARHFDALNQQKIRDRIRCLESLSQALLELNAVNMLHAQRGLQVVEGYTALLTGRASTDISDAYTNQGRARRRTSKSFWGRRI